MTNESKAKILVPINFVLTFLLICMMFSQCADRGITEKFVYSSTICFDYKCYAIRKVVKIGDIVNRLNISEDGKEILILIGAKLFLGILFLFSIYCTYVRFSNPELTETQLLLKIFMLD